MTEAEQELAPCMFCGQLPRLWINRMIDGYSEPSARVACECGLRGKVFSGDDVSQKARDWWNRGSDGRVHLEEENKSLHLRISELLLCVSEDDPWHWIGDPAEDDLESMGANMVIRITAAQLRSFLEAEKPDLRLWPERLRQPDEVRWWGEGDRPDVVVQRDTVDDELYWAKAQRWFLGKRKTVAWLAERADLSAALMAATSEVESEQNDGTDP